METKDIFEQMAVRYDTEERKRNAKIIADQIRRELDDTQGKIALDYGCGTGLVGLELTDLFQSILLVDVSPQMVEQVQRKIELRHLSNANAQCCNFLEEMPSGLKSDYILISQVLLHVKDFVLLLNRFYDVLNPDGYLVIVDFDKNEKIMSDKVHNGFEQSELIQLLKDIGFDLINAHTFYHGEKMFMHEDASLFILVIKK